MELGTVNQRLAKNVFHTDDNPHIEINQELLRRSASAQRIINICPARVYSMEANGEVRAEHAACLECGACLAVATPGSLRWVYPQGGMGIEYREG